MAEVHAWFPRKLDILFKRARYKVAHGGRGGAKSWSFARALLIIGAERPIRVLCTREVQKSIKQSVHQLLKDQIAELRLGQHYDVLDAEIRGKNGTLFLFAGLSDQTADSLKSFEGIDICWCEEAQSITAKSWNVLIPTIRKEGSEIWVSFNPHLETDETYRRFITAPPPDCLVVEINWSDNARFPAVLEQERLHAKATLPEEDYLWIWEGKCRAAVHGAIYAAEMAKADARITNIAHDPTLKTHVVFDLGFNDDMFIGLVQRLPGEVRVIATINGNQRLLSSYSEELRDLRLDGAKPQWGKVFLPHDGFAKKHQTGISDAQVLEALGWSVEKVPHTDVETGIKRAREMFPRTWFNRDRTAPLVECLKRYRRTINSITGQPGAPLHDEFSHGADMFRYIAMSEPEMTNDEWGGKFEQPRFSIA